MSKEILQVSHLGHRTGARWLTHDTHFTLKEGFTALIGPNGAGKSSLLRTMTGILSQDTGTLTWVDRPKGDPPGRLAYIPQFPGVYHNLTVREQLQRIRMWSQYRNHQDTADIDAMMQLWNLTDVADTVGLRLQGSQGRRLALASAWLQHVDAVLLDEPTADLDPLERLRFWQQLFITRRYSDGPRAYLVTTHRLDEVEQYCENLLFLSDGEVLYQGAVKEFVRRAETHTFYAPHAGLTHVHYTGQRDPLGYYVIAAATATYPRRMPELLDAYLVTVRQWGRKP